MHSTSLLQRGLVCGLLCAGLAACGGTNEPSSASAKAKDAVQINPDPFPSTYQPIPSATTVIQNVSILDGIGGLLENASIVFQDGKITALGNDIDA